MKMQLLQLLILTLAPFAQARDAQFESLVAELNACPRLDCSSVQIQRKPVQISNDQVRQVTRTVTTLAENIWPDTILEGPYMSDFDVRLNNIELLTVNSRGGLYRVTYSAKAWDIDSCVYEPNNKESLNSCDEGIIVETAFVSMDLTQAERDESAFASFQPRN